MNRLTEVLLLAVLGCVLAGSAWYVHRAEARPQSRAESNSFAIRDVRVFDGETVLERANVIVKDGLIAAVGEGAAIPADVEVIDGNGKTLLPGLIDAHTHSWGDAAKDALRLGVTTELELMGQPAQLAVYHQHRASTDWHEGADVFSSGAAVTVPHGHGTQFGMPVPTLKADDDVAAFVQARVDEGSDVIKLMVDDFHAYGGSHRIPTLSPAQQQAAISAAQRLGKPAIVHVAAQADAQRVIEAGADGLAHMFIDTIAEDDFIAAARERSAFVIPTLSVLATMARSEVNAELADDAALQARLTPTQQASLRALYPDSFPAQPQALDNAIESVRRLHAAGVDILAGTDAGNPGTAHGASLHGELALLVRAGLNPREALRAATALPAARLRMNDRGRIATGLRADLLLVDGDPTRRIEDTRRIVAVWKNGYRAPDTADVARAANVQAGPVSDFEDGTLSSRFGAGWYAGADNMMGARSSAKAEWLAEGADGSRGAMRVQGEVAAATASPWAGVMFSPGAAPMTPVDLRARDAVTFAIRGTPGDYVFIVIGGNGRPSAHPITVGNGWQQVRVALADLRGADLAQVGAFGVTNSRIGAFSFDIDNVVIE